MTFSILFGTLPDEEESLKEINTFYQVFSEYNRQSALLVDRIPIYMLPKVKKARKEIFELLKAMDWSKRINTSSLITHVRRVDSDPGSPIFLIKHCNFYKFMILTFKSIYFIMNKAAYFVNNNYGQLI